jgi:hypothetical protein
VYGYMFDRVIELPFLVAAALVAATILLGLGMETYALTPSSRPAAPV